MNRNYVSRDHYIYYNIVYILVYKLSTLMYIGLLEERVSLIADKKQKDIEAEAQILADKLFEKQRRDLEATYLEKSYR